MRKNDSGSIYKNFSGKGVFPHQMAVTLLIPLRNIFLSPNKLIQRLENVAYQLADGSNFPFEDNFFDRIVLVTVLGGGPRS